MTAITTEEITAGTLKGEGVFDKLMDTISVHLTSEFTAGRISGGDYSKVYSAAIQATIQQSLTFVLSRQEADAQAEILKTQKELLDIQIVGAGLDNTIKTKQATKLDSDIALTNQQLNIATVQAANLTAEGLNIPKQGAQIDATVLDIQQKTAIGVIQAANLTADGLNIPKQGLQIEATTTDITQKTAIGAIQATNLTAEGLNIPKIGNKIDSEKDLIDQNHLNAVSNNITITKQQNKLDAEKDLLSEKLITEAAQTKNLVGDVLDGVTKLTTEAPGVVGKQKILYQAQTLGFSRDAEQKAAKLFVDTWNVRRSTNDTETTGGTGLQDSNIEALLAKLMTGIGTTQLPA